MSPAGCLVVAVDIDRQAENTIRRAANVARFGDLALTVVHVVEHDAGCETDHFPFLTPDKVRAHMADHARAWLLGVVHHLGLGKSEIVALPGNLPVTLADVAAVRHARYIVTGPLRWGALSRLAGLARDPRLRDTRCEILHLGRDRRPPQQHATHCANRWS